MIYKSSRWLQFVVQWIYPLGRWNKFTPG